MLLILMANLTVKTKHKNNLLEKIWSFISQIGRLKALLIF